MAEPFDTLLLVQEHDTTIDQLRHRKVTMAERAALAELEKRHAELDVASTGLRAQVEDLAGRQRSIEEQIAASAKRRHDIEQRMLSGDMSASRDLQAMDTEVHHLSERQSALEEAELELLEEEDPLDTALAENTSAAEAMVSEEERLRLAVAAIEADIDAEIEKEVAARAVQAAVIPADLAARYEKLRDRLGGVGAARLIENHCGGCHLVMPSMEVERLRRLPLDEIATCDQCGRILVR
jgi:predicted  nucleic acid-binding Zn-ribbon protein